MTGLVLVLLAALEAAPKTPAWQTCQVASVRAETTDRDREWTSYIYTLQCKDRAFDVVLPAPLKAPLRTNVKFALEKDLVYIQDADGKVKKACLLEPAAPGH